MKTIAVLTAALLLGGSAAAAADLGGYKEPAPYRMQSSTSTSNSLSWTGFTFGAHIGSLTADHDVTVNETETTPGTPETCDNGIPENGQCRVTIIDEPEIPETCTYASDDFPTVLKNGRCYPVIYDADGVPVTSPYWYYPSTPGKPAVTHTELTDDGYHDAIDGAAIVRKTLFSLDPNGIYGGVSIGADYQPEGSNIVFGLFGELNIADVNEHDTQLGLEITDGNSYLFGARLGLAFDRLLAYGQGGYAIQNTTYDFADRSVDKTFGHPFLGLGVGYRLSNNLSLDANYKHLFRSEETFYNEGGIVARDERSDDRFQVGFKYHFPVR